MSKAGVINQVTTRKEKAPARQEVGSLPHRSSWLPSDKQRRGKTRGSKTRRKMQRGIVARAALPGESHAHS